MNTIRPLILLAALLLSHNVFAQSKRTSHELIVGLPCEGCEWVFYGKPKSIPTVSRIAPADEPGEAMTIEGIVRDQRGNPAAGIIVYAYHTNAQGIYPEDTLAQRQFGVRHGKLRGWAMTDARGYYRFDTIRPAGYPNSDIPQHVHMHIIEPGRCTYYIDDLIFEDDSRLTEQGIEEMSPGRGGQGLAKPNKDKSGRWMAIRDIILGKNIPDYPTR